MKVPRRSLDRCPVCWCELLYSQWLEEHQLFLVQCRQCTTFTITATLAELFQGSLAPHDRLLVERLSRYLYRAGDDDERELTETSWVRLSAEE